MEKTIRVYVKPDCRQCDATKRHLDRAGVAYELEPITDQVIEAAKSLGVTSAPIVMLGNKIIGGYNPVALDEFIAEVAA